ncbi:hypothetical protein DYB26_013257 [Aphanomyces astaci]|uniref:Uncharacterized protein n=1 Tax=Aphanomyces astaci TaxID=112090 RepID=A0A3R6Z7C3_APHAT|nr:hypothetical protein DYB26_013257 [Aphanomyces astaci]
MYCSTVAPTLSKASPKDKQRTKGKASAKGRSYKRKVPSAAAPVIHVDENEEVEGQDANSFFDHTSQAPLHRRGSEDFSAFGEDVVKMEATARTGEPSSAMKNFGGSIDVDLVTRHMALLTAPTLSPPLHVEDIPMLDNIMDDEQHAAVETEKYERTWPEGKMFGDDDNDVDPDQTT